MLGQHARDCNDRRDRRRAAAAAGNMFWVLRTTGDRMDLAAALATVVRRIDPEVAASQIRPLETYLSAAVAPRRFSLSLMAAFGIAALALALAGIYAVVTYSVSQRAREIAIRVALGASRADVTRLVMAQGLRFILIGLIIGLAIAAGVARLLAATLVGVSATDPATFGQVAGVVATMATVACAVPTVRLGRLVVGVLRTE
jgi:putative ABC transport system permease protein